MSDTPYPSLSSLVQRALRHVEDWEQSWGTFDHHSSLGVDRDRLDEAMSEYLERLEGNYPFHHPRYAGQMLKPPHPVALAAYVAAQRINPNNHALDGGPPTSRMEKEVVAELADMIGLPQETLGHLTGGGTVANLEALWVARELHPEQAVAVGENAHYTHGRAGELLDLDIVSIPCDAQGRLDLEALTETLEREPIGTVVVTAGTTGLGTVDPIDEVIPLCAAHDVRVHADAAYGGFFRILVDEKAPDISNFPTERFRALEDCDSVAIDPHKHGLQPYGCGCILFRNPAVGRFYQHDSPYTYFTSDELHLGEISLECSRPGAAAGALWCTLRTLPLEPDEGLGPVLAACLRAARGWAEHVEDTDALTLVASPETDIVTYMPTPPAPRLTALHDASQALFETAMKVEDPVFTSVYELSAETLTALHPSLTADRPNAAVLRSVLMKPEHEPRAQTLVRRLAECASSISDRDG